MTTPAEPHELLDRARAADPEAISFIYEQYANSIFRYIYYRIGDAEQARDLQSEVFVRMLEGIARYEDRGWSIGAWLYRIAHDRTIDVLRRQQRHSFQPLQEWSEVVDGPEWISELRSEQSRVHRVMKRLNDDQRRVIMLRFIYDLSLQATATQLGRTVGAVKSIQYRALENLRRMLLEDEPNLMA